MRRRQTVLGEQLNGLNFNLSSVPSANHIPIINVPPGVNIGNGSSTSVGRHIRSFSRLSSRNITMNSLNGSLAQPYSSLVGDMLVPDETLVSSDAVSVISAQQEDEFDNSLLAGSVDPISYLSRTLAGAGSREILKLGEQLRAQVQRALDSDKKKLQHSHKAMITVARSIAKLAPAVAELHKQVGDLSLMSDAMRQDAFASQTAGLGAGTGLSGSGNLGLTSPKSLSMASQHGDDILAEDPLGGRNSAVPIFMDKRQSMLVLNPAWANALNDLYRRVNGAQRVLPPAPGRHVVHEEHNWSELNLVTQKPTRPVLIVVLNDYLLIAAPKLGRFAHAYHIPLEESLQCNIAESTRVLNVDKDTVQISLQAPSLSRLRVVFSEICKHMELASSQRRTGLHGNALKKMPGSRLSEHGGPQLCDNYESRQVSSRNSRGLSSLHARKISQSSIASSSDLKIERRREAARILADMDRYIALRDWPEATRQCLNYEDDALVGSQVAERRKKLTEVLLEELRDRRMGMAREDKCLIVQQLSKLNHTLEAKHALLDTAAADIESQARHVHFMGDVVNYISQMAAIYFQTIISAVQIYQKCFPAKVDSSLAVSWVKSQVDLYAAIFNRQLFRIAPEFRAYQRCRNISRLESSQLRELSLDMEFMLRYVWES